METLIEAGADPNARDADQDFAPLHIAALRGQAKTAVTLIKGGANPDARLNNGFTPLDLAVHKGHSKTAAALIAAGASPDARRGLR